jgi:RNA polymerase sigma-70 factor (sigma-E family)
VKRKTAERSSQEFEAFVTQTADPLFRSGYLMTANVAETEDLLQETFLRVARHWNRVRSMEYPLAYARRILINLALDGAASRDRRGQELRNPDEAAQVVDQGSLCQLSGIDDQAEFKWALTALPPRQRAVLILRYWDDLSEREVAEILRCPIGTVKSTTSRGVTELRSLLGRGENVIPISSHTKSDEEEASC